MSSGALSFQQFVEAQLDELRHRLLSEYEKQHGNSSSAEEAEAPRPHRQLRAEGCHETSAPDVPQASSSRSAATGPQAPGAKPVATVNDQPEMVLDEMSEGPVAVGVRAIDINISSMKIGDASAVRVLTPGNGAALTPPGNPRAGTPSSARGGGAHDYRQEKEDRLGTPISSKSKGYNIERNLSHQSAASLEDLRKIGMDVPRPLPKIDDNDNIMREGRRPNRGNLDDIGKGSVASVEEKQATFSKDWVILPGSTFYKCWQHSISLLVLLSCFFTPMRFGFNEALEPARQLETFLDIFFALDIMITFNVALHTKSGIDESRWNIFKAYAGSFRFYVDLLATVPFDDVWAICVGDSTRTDRNVSRSLGMLRMLRVNRMLILFREMQKNTKFNLLGVVVAKFVVFIMLCTHTAGCLFYSLAYYADFGTDTWVHNVNPNLPTESLVTRYLNVLFWAVGTFKAGPMSGSLGPNSNAEKVLACLTMMVNICLQTYLVSNMAALLTTADVRIYAMRNQMRQLEEFAKRYNLPQELRHQLRMCVRFKFASDQELDANVLGGLPDLYRQRISHVLFEDIISEVELFTDCAPLFLRQLHSSFKSTLYMPDQQLVNIDEPSSHLQIISEGEVEMRDRAGCIVGMSGATESFSAVSFLCKVGAPFAVRTRVVTRVMSLDFASWDNACSAFPENLHQVKINLLHHCEKKANEFVEGCAGYIIYRELASVVQQYLVHERETGIALFVAAAARGDLGELKRIMIAQTPNCSNYDSRTPLHMAAAYGQVEAIQLLLDSAAFVDPVDNFGRSPLLEACRCRQEKAAQLLHHNGAVLDTMDNDTGHGEMSSKSSKDGVEKLCAAGELCEAASDVDKLWYLKMLLKYGANPNVGDYDKRTALHVACASGNKPAVELLAGFRRINLDPKDNFGRTPLMEAVRHGHESVAKILKAKGAFHGFVIDAKDNDDPNAILAGGELCQAAAANEIGYMNNLLAYCDLDVDAADYDLRTALMLACAEGNMGIAVHLVQNGADINKKDRWGHTAITEAIEHGHRDLADVLKQIVGHGTLHKNVASHL